MSARGDPGRILHILTGCTAVGKTEWALRWAEAEGAEILSCDSLLFYRGMDIGTAKPSGEERRRVRHHLIDIREVSETMNVARYAELAHAAALDIASRGRKVLVVGGSGFYLKSFLAPVSDGVEVPAEVRAQVAKMEATGGLHALVEALRRLNPGGTGAVDLANPRRVAGALGRCLASGRTLADLAKGFSQARPAFEGWEIRLERIDRSAVEIDERIRKRVEAMLAEGLVGEVERLLAAGLLANPSAARAIGYRETIDALEGRLPMAGLAEVIADDTRALVKKQRTWFRTQVVAHRVHDASRDDWTALFLR